MLYGMGPGGQTAPPSPTACATLAAVAGASPVTITVRTPNPSNSVISAADSARGGSLRAMRPINFIPSGGPAATASTLNPFPSSSVAAAAAAGDALTRLLTVAK